MFHVCTNIYILFNIIEEKKKKKIIKIAEKYLIKYFELNFIYIQIFN